MTCSYSRKKCPAAVHMGWSYSCPKEMRESGVCCLSMARNKKSRNWRAKPTYPKAGRISAGHWPALLSTCPASSSRMTASCSAPVIKRISSSLSNRSKAKASECTERTMADSATNSFPLAAAKREVISSRRRAPDSFEAATTRMLSGSCPSSIWCRTVSAKKLVRPEPAAPLTT